MEDLLAHFVPKFAAVAKTRVVRGLEIAAQRDHEAAADTVRDLHAVAGEAGLLGLNALVPLARDSEEKAKRLRATRSAEDAEALYSSLTELKRAIELVAPANQPDGGRS